MNAAPFETFSSLTAHSWLRHGFIQRTPQIALQVEREIALERLRESHQAAIAEIGLATKTLITAQQVHSQNVERVDRNSIGVRAECDGLLTNDPQISLGIYTADCGAIFLADPEHRAIGLLHSGRKGTELGILSVAIEKMQQEFGTDPRLLTIQLAPCIRPPHYEIDFAADIQHQANSAGVKNYHDCGACTASDLEKYYSYRRELGKTGRHLSVLGYAS